MRAATLCPSSRYPYGGTANANPDAVTQIATGYSTTSLSYDADGNLIQKSVDGTTTTYVYDYANRLTALGTGGATTTYGYDWAGNRVSQTGTTTTYLYPFKWYSVASSTGSGAKYATTTDYMFNGDTLLATVDQQTASGNATGTAKTRYVHPDHLGSTMRSRRRIQAHVVGVSPAVLPPSPLWQPCSSSLTTSTALSRAAAARHRAAPRHAPAGPRAPPAPRTRHLAPYIAPARAGKFAAPRSGTVAAVK
jgi:YD repeat-containing protein